MPNQWLDTRHFFTHWDEELRPNILDSQGLYDANVRLKHFLRSLYLSIVDIPQQSILNALNGISESSRHLAQLNAEEKGSKNSTT